MSILCPALGDVVAVCCSFCGSICFVLTVVGIQNQW